MDLTFVNRMLGISRGGGEIWDLKMAEGLEELGADVTFYVGKPLRSELPEPIEDFDYVEVPTPHLRDLAYAAPIGVGGALSDLDARLFTLRVVSRLQENEHDIIHVNSDPQFGRIVSQFDVPVTIKMNGPPHSLWYDYVNPFGSSYDFFRCFDAVIATGVTVPAIRERTDCEVTTVNPGVDTELFSPEGPEIPTNRPTVLFVGRFVPAKNIALLLEAFSEVLNEIPNAELILVGEGPLEEKIASRVESLGISRSIRMPGYVENEELPRYYRGADLFALTSRHESFGMVLLEAMSCGTPVVSSRAGAAHKIVDHSVNGLLYTEGNKEELVNSLEIVLQNTDLKHQMEANAREITKSQYDWEIPAKQLHNMYTEICKII